MNQSIFIAFLTLIVAALSSCTAKAKYQMIVTNQSGQKEIVAEFYQVGAGDDCEELAKRWKQNYPDAKCINLWLH